MNTKEKIETEYSEEDQKVIDDFDNNIKAFREAGLEHSVDELIKEKTKFIATRIPKFVIIKP